VEKWELAGKMAGLKVRETSATLSLGIKMFVAVDKVSRTSVGSRKRWSI